MEPEFFNIPDDIYRDFEDIHQKTMHKAQKLRIKKQQELMPVFIVVHGNHKTIVPALFEDDEQKEIYLRIVRYIAIQKRAEAVLFVCEGWGPQRNGARIELLTCILWLKGIGGRLLHSEIERKGKKIAFGPTIGDKLGAGLFRDLCGENIPPPLQHAIQNMSDAHLKQIITATTKLINIELDLPQ